MTSGADLRVAFVAETTFGDTPATPSFDTLRVTSGGLQTSKGTAVLDEIRSDQNVVDEVQVSQDVDGSYPFEFSYGSFDDLLEAALGSSWSSDVIQNGTTERSFSFEETIERGATDAYRLFKGCRINTFSLNITARQKITGSIGILGKQEVISTAAVAGATYTDPNSETVMVAGASVGSISISGLTNPCVQSMSIEINRNMRRINCVDSIHSDDIANGRCDVTGEIEVYFKDNAEYEAFLNHSTASISATIGHDADKKYTISIPRAVWLSGAMKVGGNDDDIMVRLPFRGTLSSDHSIQFTRAVA